MTGNRDSVREVGTSPVPDGSPLSALMRCVAVIAEDGETPATGGDDQTAASGSVPPAAPLSGPPAPVKPRRRKAQ